MATDAWGAMRLSRHPRTYWTTAPLSADAREDGMAGLLLGRNLDLLLGLAVAVLGRDLCIIRTFLRVILWICHNSTCLFCCFCH